MDELLPIPGVARKTANVVLGTWYKIADGVVVDTHVQRISRRLELTKNEEPQKIEQDLMKVIPRDKWILFSHQIILHGRALCVARTRNAPIARWKTSATLPIRRGARWICTKAQWLVVRTRWLVVSCQWLDHSGPKALPHTWFLPR